MQARIPFRLSSALYVLIHGCGNENEAPPPHVKLGDHFVCVESDTDVDFGETDISNVDVSDSDVETGQAPDGIRLSEFEARLDARMQPIDDGRMLLDGDVVLRTRDAQRIHERLHQVTTNRFRSTLKCMVLDQLDETWDRARLVSLTYCFEPFDDLALESAIRQAIDSRIWEYELVSDTNFVHREELDGSDCNDASDVVFRIRQGNAGDCGFLGCPLASAFFPADANAETEEVVFFPSVLDDDVFTVGGTVQHEFGHILGLFHEHARYEQLDGQLSPTEELSCVATSGFTSLWRGVTPPDPDSIMGYSYCRGTKNGTDRLSPFDRVALRYLYNLPASTHRSLDENMTADIFWYRPGNGHISIWYGVANDGDISFTSVDYCVDGTVPAPECGLPAPALWKPVPLRDGGQTHVLMFGPGVTDDLLFVTPSQADGTTAIQSVSITLRTAVPRVGNFVAGDADDIMMTIPGPGNGDRVFTSTLTAFTDYDDIAGMDSYYDAIVGRLVEREGSIGDQILWYAERTPQWRLSYRTAQGVVDEPFDASDCGFVLDDAVNAISGNFDDDANIEVLWYSYGRETAVLWFDLDNCAQERVTFPIMGRPKAHPGDIDGDGAIDVLWDRQGEDDEVWRFENQNDPTITLATFPDESFPVVGDFDGDGCSDVLWYRGYAAESPLWRSLCNGAFTTSLVGTPQHASPVGYGYGHGRTFGTF